MINLTINTENDAFEGAGCSEVARILREFADKIEGCALPVHVAETFGLYDVNGNRVGEVTIQKD